ncbi:hypothetical protein HYU21_00545 [Candidatus Woesearchaeota archaeon]|nr:hypothetical protein [Candidatus Woesearchaeota archaeon]
MTNETLDNVIYASFGNRQSAEQSAENLQRYNMGMAVVDGNTVMVYNSDNPKPQIREAINMDKLVKEYLSSSKGSALMDYIRFRGGRLLDIKGVGAGDLGEGVVAALLYDGLEGYILSNYDGKTFESRVYEMAQKYGIDEKAMVEYVLTHELGHAAGYHSEEGVEGFIKDYFTSQAFRSSGEEREKYLELAKIAEEREAEAKDAGK